MTTTAEHAAGFVAHLRDELEMTARYLELGDSSFDSSEFHRLVAETVDLRSPIILCDRCGNPRNFGYSHDMSKPAIGHEFVTDARERANAHRGIIAN